MKEQTLITKPKPQGIRSKNKIYTWINSTMRSKQIYLWFTRSPIKSSQINNLYTSWRSSYRS